MDSIVAILEQTGSTDNDVRGNAEAQLSLQLQENFAQFMTILAKELATESNSSYARQAAALYLKNALLSRDQALFEQLKIRWLEQISPENKTEIRNHCFAVLRSADAQSRNAAAQIIAAIATIELPLNLWPDLIPLLVSNVGDDASSSALKQSSVKTIGYICEVEDAALRQVLASQSNAILTAVVQGAKKDEPNDDVRIAAITALSDTLEFARANFQNEYERNYIMQVICEATVANNTAIKVGAWGCLDRIMALYYDKMYPYVQKALFGLTVQGMKLPDLPENDDIQQHDDEDVAKLAVEFWSTVCDQEIEIEEDNRAAHERNSQNGVRTTFNFANIATSEIVPELLNLLTRCDKHQEDEDLHIAKAAYICLTLWAVATHDRVLDPVIKFVDKNFIDQNSSSVSWRLRNAAIEAFGAVLEGPTTNILIPLARQALPPLVGVMGEPDTGDDTSVVLKNSAAYTLGRICEHAADAIDPTEHLGPLLQALFSGLKAYPKTANSCCWALSNLVDQFANRSAQQDPLTPFFQDAINELLQLTNLSEHDEEKEKLRNAAYEVMGTFALTAAVDSLKIVAYLTTVIIERLENTIHLASQVVNNEDRLVLQGTQTSLCSVLGSIIQRLDSEIQPLADRIMQLCLQLLGTLPQKSVVPIDIYAVVSVLAHSVKHEFAKYMPSFSPYLYQGLESYQDYALCSTSIGLVDHIATALGADVQPYCRDICTRLNKCLNSPLIPQQYKPAALQAFGFIAQAIKGPFAEYLPDVVSLLTQGSAITLDISAPYEQQEYLITLREAIMETYNDIVIAMADSQQVQALSAIVEPVSNSIRLISQDAVKSEVLCASCLGVIGDLAEAFPRGEIANFFTQDWLVTFVEDIRAEEEFSSTTIKTAQWTQRLMRQQAILVMQNQRQP